MAYKLAEALYRSAGDPGGVSKYQDLAALGIVADVALLTGETRFLLQRGLECLRGSQRVGLQAIYEISGVFPASMTEEQIGFVLAPRLNALGRLSDANPAVELLTTKDVGRARILAMELEGWNSHRQLMTRQVLDAAQDQIEKNTDMTSSALVLASPSWPAGVIGIVASRLVEKYRIPAILISMPQGEQARGSARSVEGVDITQTLSTVSDLLSGFGGHAMAAGFSIDPRYIPIFSQRIRQIIQTQKHAYSSKSDSLLIEGFLEWGEINLDLANSLNQLAPFGHGNPPIILASRNLELVSYSKFGRQSEHIKLLIKDQFDNLQKVTWWGGSEPVDEYQFPNGKFDLAYQLRSSSYKGQVELSIILEDLRLEDLDDMTDNVQTRLEVNDRRTKVSPIKELLKILSNINHREIIIWAEAGEYRRLSNVLKRCRI